MENIDELSQNAVFWSSSNRGIFQCKPTIPNQSITSERFTPVTVNLNDFILCIYTDHEMVEKCLLAPKRLIKYGNCSTSFRSSFVSLCAYHTLFARLNFISNIWLWSRGPASSFFFIFRLHQTILVEKLVMIHTVKSRRELLYKLINLFNLAEKKTLLQK